MITLEIKPETLEIICIALQIADKYQQKDDAMFASESFKKVYDEIALPTEKD